MPQNSKVRNWVFTINNPTEEPTELPPGVRYLVFGREVGEQGTPHLQGFLVFQIAQRFSAVKAIFPTAHIEAAKGSFEQAADYCKKDGDFVELGVPPTSKRKKGEDEAERWSLAKKAAQEGRLDDVPDDIYLRYYRTIKEIKKDHMIVPSTLDTLDSEWWYGKSGTGKSREAHTTYPGAYLKMCNKWWDGYQGQDVVVIEDLDAAHSGLAHHLKIWGDRYPFLAETKGGAVAIRPKKIIVTSNWHPADIWTDLESIEPIQRRFKIREFK